MRDKNDPIYHDVQGDRAEDAIMARSLQWLDRQDDDVKVLFCEHGRYVGFGGVFKYKCERCTPGYVEDHPADAGL